MSAWTGTRVVPPEKVWVHPEAIAEARTAREWYQARNAEAAEAFIAELDLAIERIEEAPHQWPPYLANTRRYRLRLRPSRAPCRGRAAQGWSVSQPHPRPVSTDE